MRDHAGEVQDPSLDITFQAVKCRLPVLPVSTYSFTWSGVVIVERMQKHIVPFPTTAQHLAGELTPPDHPLCWSHTRPAPTPHACSVALAFAEFTEFIKKIVIYIQVFSSTM